MVDVRRALWVLGAGDIGGVARHTLDIFHQGIPGWKQSFLIPEGDLTDELSALGAEVVPGSSSFNKDTGTLSAVRTLRAAIKTINPDVIHSHLSWADVVTVLGTRLQSIPVVSTEHGIADMPGLYNSPGIQSEVKRQLHRWRLRHTDALICVSDATDRSVRAQWGGDRVRVRSTIPNGVDAVPIRPPRADVRIGILSRLAPEKGIDIALQGFMSFQQRYPTATLLIGGVGEVEEELRRTVRLSGLDSHVTFLGQVDPSHFWPQIDILLQTSRWENCSYSLLDGVVHGRGIVATDVGGNGEILPDSCLVRPNPTPQDIADRLEEQRTSTLLLPAHWPSVAEMTSRTGTVYNALM